MNMNILKINQKALFYPQKIAKGTQAERLLKATASSIDVFKELRYDFVNREIKASDVKRSLKKVAGKDIGVRIELKDTPNSTKTGVYGTTTGLKGYVLYLQNIFDTKKISQGQLPVIMQRINEMFIFAFNPKIIKREVSIFSKRQDLKACSEFFTEYISGKKSPTDKLLNKLLSKKSVEEQINLLQLLRYKTMTKLGLAQAESTLDRHICKFENSHIINKNYDKKIQDLNSKLEILNNKLAQIIKNERAKMS